MSLIRCLLVLLLLLVLGTAARADLITGTLTAGLDSGSLAVTMFPVTYSYDSTGVTSVGESFVTLQSFDFVLLGVPFTRNDISQGGQAIFEDGVINNVTASFQGIMPPDSPVHNITFGFGGPGVIGYIDLANQFGSGTFTFNSPVPEPDSLLLLAAIAVAFGIRSRAGGSRRPRPRPAAGW